MLSNVGGIVLFSFATGELRQVTDFGWNPLWLADSRRLLFVDTGASRPLKLYLLDTDDGDYHEVLSAESLAIAADSINAWPAISADSRTIILWPES